MRITNNKNIRKKPKIISNSYFSLNYELKKMDFNVYYPIWGRHPKEIFIGNRFIYKKTERMRNYLSRYNFLQILSKEFIEKIDSYRKNLKDFYSRQNVKALIVPFDVPFFENVAIKTFQEMNIPTFVFLHGIPGRYNNIENNRSDYLIVWGDLIKELFIKSGIKEEKIIVSGHPNYKNNPTNELSFDLSNILILTKSFGTLPPTHTRVLTDRGNSIVFILQIQKVLKELGVKSVRFRPHPSENSAWYQKFIDPNFFKLDQESLTESMKKSSLIIGPGSTVFIEALYHGVNYLIYEPSTNNISMIYKKIVPPYDGSVSEIPVAKNEEELKNFIENKTKVDLSILNKFIKTPFDLGSIKEIIKS